MREVLPGNGVQKNQKHLRGEPKNKLDNSRQREPTGIEERRIKLANRGGNGEGEKSTLGEKLDEAVRAVTVNGLRRWEGGRERSECGCWLVIFYFSFYFIFLFFAESGTRPKISVAGTVLGNWCHSTRPCK